MRYFEILEGIRMGARDLAQPTKKNYTIGFEFEVQLDSGFPSEGGTDPGEIDWDAVADAHYDAWYNGGRNDFDFKEWFDRDYLRNNRSGIQGLVIDNDFEPKYGWVDNPDDYIESLNTAAKSKYERDKAILQQRIDEYDPEYIQKFKDFYNEYRNNREEIVNDFDKIKEMTLLMQSNEPMQKRIYPDEKNRIETLKDQIENSTKEKVKLIFANNIKTLSNLVFRKIQEPYMYTKEDDEYQDFDPDDQQFVYDKYKNVLELDSDITDYDDLIENFNVDEDDLRDALESEWQDAETEARDNDFNDWINYNAERFTSGGDGPLGYVKEQLEDELGYDWSVVSDSSLSRGAEIVSDVFNDFRSGIEAMKSVFELIQNDPYMYTDNQTGLHINIGTWKGDDIDKVDWLKFLVVYRAERVLEEFKRLSNTYAPDKLQNIISSLEVGNLKPFYENISSINSQVIGSSGKHSAVNLSKLYQYGIIELRAPGNRGYENKGQYLEKEIRKIGRALDIASDPNAYKTEYAKKLYKLLASQTNRRLGRGDNLVTDPVNDFFKQISNGLSSDYKYLGASRIISSIIEANGLLKDFNQQAANTRYTARVHKLIMDDLREFQRINGSNVREVFEHYLKKYDQDNTIRNSKFMSMILKALA